MQCVAGCRATDGPREQDTSPLPLTYEKESDTVSASPPLSWWRLALFLARSVAILS